MIICVNGKCVGNMTMAELHIEFDICGSEMMLTVSRFDIPENDANEASETLQDLAMDWNDIGACSSLKRKRVSFEDDRSSSNVPHLFDVQPYLPDIEDDDIQENDHDNMNRGVEVDDWQNHVANPCHTTIAEIPMARNETHHLSQHAEDNIEPARSKSGMSPLTIHRESTTEEITKLEGRASLSMAAELGCRKCKRELRTGIKTNATHDLNCPRKFKPKSTTHRKSGRRAEHSMRVGKKGGHGSRRNPSKSRLQRSTSQKEEDTDASYIEETSDIDEIEFSSKRSTTNRPSRARTTDSNTLKYGNTKDTCDGKEDEEENSDSDEEDGDDDENPWLGCVCGSTHPHPIKVFWIQCEGCEAWYNAAEECLGFDEYAAQELSNWCCWACNPPVAGMGL